jgi:hypothetical protein
MPRVVAPPSPLPDGGWALRTDIRHRLGLTYLPTGPDDPEPSYTLADAWEPPHQLALGDDLCDAIRETAAKPSVTPNGTYHYAGLPDDLHAEIVRRAKAANETWWRFVIDDWPTAVKSYGVGQRHQRHQDLAAGYTRRKLAGIVQLSHPDDYEGGDLVIHNGGLYRLPLPRTRGTFIAFTGWAVHEVEEVTAGERWSLCWNGYGPPLR